MKAPSSRIRIFWNPHFFFPDSIILSSTRSKNIRLRCQIRRMRVEGSRIWKEKVADSKIFRYVWTGPMYVQRDLGT